MNENLDIFICTHKDFKDYPRNHVYKILTGHNCLNNTYDLPIYEEGYGKYTYIQKYVNEFTRMHWASENITLKDYVGFCHYTRFFNFYDNVPDVNMLFKTHDIIVKKPTHSSLGNIIQQYTTYHNMGDYYIIRKIIHDLHGISYADIERCENYLIPCNIFIMPVNKFGEYVRFVSSIIDEFLKIMQFKSGEDIVQHVKDNWVFYNKFGMTIEYQSRIVAFLIERITTIFIGLNFNNPMFIETVHYNINDNDVKKYFNSEKNNIYHTNE